MPDPTGPKERARRAPSQSDRPLRQRGQEIEQRRSGNAGRRLAFIRSRLTIVEVTEQIADEAAALLDSTGLTRHECVVDALVVATAASALGPAKVVSSDSSHVPALCKAAIERRTSPVEWVRV
jgi:Arc/MetJ family transcription regulator